MSKYGKVFPSDKDIDTVYSCSKCGKTMVITDARIIPEHRIPGWIVHKGWAYTLQCPECTKEKAQ